MLYNQYISSWLMEAKWKYIKGWGLMLRPLRLWNFIHVVCGCGQNYSIVFWRPKTYRRLSWFAWVVVRNHVIEICPMRHIFNSKRFQKMRRFKRFSFTRWPRHNFLFANIKINVICKSQRNHLLLMSQHFWTRLAWMIYLCFCLASRVILASVFLLR